MRPTPWAEIGKDHTIQSNRQSDAGRVLLSLKYSKSPLTISRTPGIDPRIRFCATSRAGSGIWCLLDAAFVSSAMASMNSWSLLVMFTTRCIRSSTSSLRPSGGRCVGCRLPHQGPIRPGPPEDGLSHGYNADAIFPTDKRLLASHVKSSPVNRNRWNAHGLLNAPMRSFPLIGSSASHSRRAGLNV